MIDEMLIGGVVGSVATFLVITSILLVTVIVCTFYRRRILRARLKKLDLVQ